MSDDSDDGSGSGISATDLSMRTKKILHAVVAEYLNRGEAVGSRTVTRRQEIDLSAATVRNVMSDLEEMGLLDQPHTSAGRIPTGQGLRIFVDSLLKVRTLSPAEKEAIRVRCGGESLDLDDILRETSRTLSEFTKYTGIVLAPNPASQTLRHIEFVPIGEDRLLCVLVTTDGHIENKLISPTSQVGSDQLVRINNYLGERWSGRTIADIQATVRTELAGDEHQFDEMKTSALELSKAAVESSPAELIVSGQSNLLDASGPSNLENTRELLRVLEDKQTLVQLLDDTLAAERIQVFLGAESEQGPFNGASLVTMPYHSGDQPIGAIAVIGPTRMNYGKVMSVVDFTAAMVSRLLGDS